MENIQLDQGTIITRIRSEKYPGIKCFGILITASCDIANKKVQKYYYVTALNAKEWLTSEPGFREVFGSYIHDLFNKLERATNDVNDLINLDSLKKLPVDAAKNTIMHNKPSESNRDQTKKWNCLMKAYEDYSRFEHPDMTANDRQEAVRYWKENQKVLKTATASLKDISQGKRFHNYYLPIKAYIDQCNLCSDGLIADFEELGFLYLRDLDRLKSPGFDQYSLNPEHEKEIGYSQEDCARYKQMFFIDDIPGEESDGNYVDIAGQIQSPWREHFIQRMSFSFSRIGLENITDADYHTLIQNV